MTLGEERFTVPEALFQPHVIGQDGVGLAELTYDVIQSTDMTIRRELRQHILLSGGTSMLPGIGTRLEKDLIQLILERIFKGNVHRLEVRRQFWELEQRITKEKQVGKVS